MTDEFVLNAPHEVAQKGSQQCPTGNVQREMHTQVYAAISNKNAPSQQEPKPTSTTQKKAHVQGDARVIRGMGTDESKSAASVRLALSRRCYQVHVIAQLNGM